MHKIVHFITGLEEGGAERMLVRLLPRLTRFDHHVCAMFGPGPIGEFLTAAGIPVTYLKGSRRNLILKSIELSRFLKKTNPSIVSTYLPHADLLGRFVAKARTQSVVVCNLRSTLRDHWLPHVLDRGSNCLVNRYTANSNAVLGHYTNDWGFPAGKFEVIGNAVDDAWFRDPPTSPESPKEIVLFCMARLHPRKGHVYLFDALRSLRSEFPALRLKLLGDGPDETRLKNYVREVGITNSVEFLGEVKNPIPTLSEPGIFVLPTLFEGMSNALLEAMALGLPIIATDIPENREILTDQKTALLVPMKDDIALAKAIRQLLLDASLRNSITQNARAAAESYRLPKIIERWDRFYSSLIDAPK